MLRVVTLNLWNLSGPWRLRRAEVVAWLNRLEAPIVCFQEVIDDGTRNSARWLAEETGYDSVVFGGEDTELGEGVRFGNAILSKWPIDHSRVYKLPNEPGPTDIQRQLMHVRTNGIDVFTTHLTWLYESGRLRERQVVAIDELIKQHANPDSPVPPILTGDFNADPDSTEIRFLCGLATLEGRSTYYQDAWRVAGGGGPGWTWDNRNPFAASEFEPDRRIDYVFVGWRRAGGAGRVESCRVIADRALTGTYATDHYGVVADIAD